MSVPNKLNQARELLARANRMIANEGVLDAFGHVTMRHPTDPGRYLMSYSRGPELVQPDDILEFTLNSQIVKPVEMRLYGERVIHGEIYKARPDVNAVCHHHAPSILPFCISGVELKPVYHLGATLGAKVPFWDSRDEFGDTSLIVAKPEEGASLARALGPHWIVLMRRHGATRRRQDAGGADVPHHLHRAQRGDADRRPPRSATSRRSTPPRPSSPANTICGRARWRAPGNTGRCGWTRRKACYRAGQAGAPSETNALKSKRKTLGEVLAAIGRERRAGDEAGLVGGEEHHAARDLLRLAEAADRDLRQDALLEHLLRHRQHHFGADIAGADRIDGDAGGAPSCASALTKPISPALAAE